MSKKKAAKAATPKPPASAQSSRSGSSTRKAKPPARGARQPNLPTMRNMRIRELDDICDTIDENRAQIATLQGDEQGYEQTAMRLMRKHNQTTWNRGRVTLTRTPGEERLIVKTSRKKGATAPATPEPAAPPPPADDPDALEVHDDDGLDD